MLLETVLKVQISKSNLCVCGQQERRDMCVDYGRLDVEDFKPYSLLAPA